MSFQQAILDWAPSYMIQTYCGTLLQAVGSTLDELAERVQFGRLASNPLHCEPDAFPYHSRDRQLRLYATESDLSKRLRLARWLAFHQMRATHFGELENLQPYFTPSTPGAWQLPKIRIVHQDGSGSIATWWTLNADGTRELYQADPSNWDWDGVPSKWARFWVILYIDGTMFEGLCAQYDDGTMYDDGNTVYDGLTAAINEDLVAMIQEAQSLHATLWGFALAMDPDMFDPTSTVTTDPSGWTSLPTGNWGNIIDPATNLPTRNPAASWIYDLGQG